MEVKETEDGEYYADEDIADLIDDPWQRFDCPGDPNGCVATFADPEYSAAGRDTVGLVKMSQLREIAEKKMVDLNAGSVEAAMKIIAGTARSMGLEVV